jgi:putative ABC transport system permease protein
MRPHGILNFAIRNVLRAPLRSSLTSLGVIAGVAAVVATVSIGMGARASLEETLAKPQSRTVFLGATLPNTAYARATIASPRSGGLTADDYVALSQTVMNVIVAASPRILIKGSVQANGRGAEAALDGIDVGGFLTISRELLHGSLFSQRDVESAASVCVLSEALANEIFVHQTPLGRTVRINEVPFLVVGVIADLHQEGPDVFKASDLRVYVPFTSLLRRLNRDAPMSISMQARDIEHVALVQRLVNELIEQRRNGRKVGFYTSNAVESIKSYADGSLTMARLLSALGTVALLVGGIGIMNIMLVSVTERTREIGIRGALGTRPMDILLQFLAEALALSLLGGAIGLILGATAAWGITNLYGWRTSIDSASAVTALLCSLAVGVVFGFQPARRAASLRPIDALRLEG